ncbi:MAG TPA: peptidoglycan DD-metalloendopeptidase family protein [Alphaproteobacteria bacterium]|nr:peptidoglycan DD-metalloendopeptidase family protein [Alphaproteobacteria bacterium]
MRRNSAASSHRAPWLCVAAALLLWPISAAAAETTATPAPSLKDVERDLSAAREREKRLAAEAASQVSAIETLRAQLEAAAAATQDNEEQLSAVETTLTALDEQQIAKAAELEKRRAELARLLSALTQLARNPPEALMLMPTTPADTVRTARLLGDVVPPIEAMAKDVAHDLDELRGLRARVATERKTLADAKQRLAANHERLQQLVAARAAVYQQTAAARAEAAEQVEALGRQAANLQDLVRRLDERSTAAATRPSHSQVNRTDLNQSEANRADAKGAELEARVTEGLTAHLRHLGQPRNQMVLPARGKILLGFGDSAEGGAPQRGLTIETRPGAAVVAPFDGRIVFAGPFRGYGRILIIEHGGAYHTLLAGLGRIDVSVGQVVAMGEPIATANSPETAGPTDVALPAADIYSKGASGPVIYVELRSHGTPINPLPWLATSNGKVSG